MWISGPRRGGNGIQLRSKKLTLQEVIAAMQTALVVAARKVMIQMRRRSTN